MVHYRQSTRICAEISYSSVSTSKSHSDDHRRDQKIPSGRKFIARIQEHPRYGVPHFEDARTVGSGGQRSDDREDRGSHAGAGKRSGVCTGCDFDPVSLFDPVYNKSGDALMLMDQIGDEKNNDEVWTEHAALAEAMDHLSERERKILQLRYYEGKTQTEISDEVGIYQAQVSRLEKNAINSMRSGIAYE